MARKPKIYEVEYEQTITVKAKVEATSQREAVRLAKDEIEDYEWEEVRRTNPFKVRIAGTKGSSAERYFARQKTHDGPWGSPEQWEEKVKKALGFSIQSDALDILGLEKMPETVKDLRRARAAAQTKAHPDKGGSEDQSAKINEAFAQLRVLLKTTEDTVTAKPEPKKKSKPRPKQSPIDKLAAKLKKAAQKYYDGNPIMDDDDFDAMRDELEAKSPDHPFLSQVGAEPTSGVWPKVAPVMPMGSQKKIKTEDELNDWFRNYTNGSDLFWSDKLDGGSIEQVYENGVLVRGITRGGGNLGEEITVNVKHMQGVPKKISYKGKIAIRSEVMLLTADWQTHFPDKKEARSAASGQARSQKNQDKLKHLRLYSFDAFIPDDPEFFKTKEEIFAFLKKEGFIVPNHGMIGRDIDKMQQIKDDYEESLRAGLPYEIDGLVVEVNDLAVARELGDSNGRPRGARAYKFHSMAYETELLEVVWQVGRTCISPVGIIKPTTINGSTINRVTLCNIDKIAEWGLGVGSQIKICRSNDVIPKLLEAITQGEKIIPPEFCPSCEAPTESDGVRVYCTGDSCDGSTAKTIRHYLVALDVKGLGKAQISSFVESGIVETPVDLYSLTPEDFDSEKIGVKVLADLEAKSRNVPVFHFVKSLGFRLFGRGNTKKVLRVIPTFEGIRNATVNELASIDEIGYEVAKAAVEGFKASSDLIDELLQHVTLQDHTRTETQAAGDLVGKSFVFTGYRNKEAEAIIEERGGKISSGVSKSVTYVVAKDANGGSSKLVKARSLGIIILDPEGLEGLLG